MNFKLKVGPRERGGLVTVANRQGPSHQPPSSLPSSSCGGGGGQELFEAPGSLKSFLRHNGRNMMMDTRLLETSFASSHNHVLARLGRPIPGPFAHFTAPIAPYSVPLPHPYDYRQTSHHHGAPAGGIPYTIDGILGTASPHSAAASIAASVAATVTTCAGGSVGSHGHGVGSLHHHLRAEGLLSAAAAAVRAQNKKGKNWFFSSFEDPRGSIFRSPSPLTLHRSLYV